MFVLKQKNEQGNFVSNLRKTTEILRNSCKFIPKTAFRRSAKCLKKIESESLNEHKSDIEKDYEIETEDVCILEEPNGLFK